MCRPPEKPIGEQALHAMQMYSEWLNLPKSVLVLQQGGGWCKV